jgi:hypothetical protein
MARSNGQNGQVPPAAPHWQGENTAFPQPTFQQQGHAPQHGHGHAGHPHAGHPAAYPPQPAFAPSPDLPPFAQAPQPQLAAYAPQPRTQPYAQGPAPGHPSQGWPQPDPAGYDLGQFGHGPGHVQGHGGQGNGGQGHGGQAMAPPTLPWTHANGPAVADPHFPSPASFAEPVPTQRGASYAPAAAGMAGAVAAHQMAHAGQTSLQGHLGQPPLNQHPQDQHAPQAQQEAYDEEYDDEEYEDEEPKRGRKLMVVGALVGAICVGAGLAYAYRAFSGGKTPLIAQQTAQKAAQAPKAPPAKLPDAVPTQAVAAVTAPDDGVRRVTSIVIPPPGSSQAAAAPSTPAPPQGAPVMPGMILDGPARPAIPVLPPQGQPATQLRPSAPVPVPVPPPAAQAAPKTPAQPPAKVAVVNPQPALAPPPQTAPAPERKAAPVAKAKVDDALRPANAPGQAAPAAAPTAPAPAAKSALGATGGSNGFVATVLSTQKGRPDAMKAFADLQQKFPTVLGAKPAEVQEKDLGPKGVWFRAVVGPPGSRAAAADVCTQLKASGYEQCFVTSY